MTLPDETWAEHRNVVQALMTLSQEHSIWYSNYSTFCNMTDDNRYRWWERAKKQAALGAPAMQTLLSKVIELRLTQ